MAQPPYIPNLDHVSNSLEAMSHQLRNQFGGGQRGPFGPPSAPPASTLTEVHNRINNLAQQIDAIRNDMNMRLTRLEASDWNQRARNLNLARPRHEVRLTPLTHHLHNTAIEGFPKNDPECFHLSDLEIQRILHSLGHAGQDSFTRRGFLEDVIGIKDE